MPQQNMYDLAREVNKKKRQALADYTQNKINLTQLTQRFYDINNVVPPQCHLDPDFQRIVTDKTGMDMNEIMAFTLANNQAIKKKLAERRQ